MTPDERAHRIIQRAFILQGARPDHAAKAASMVVNAMFKAGLSIRKRYVMKRTRRTATPSTKLTAAIVRSIKRQYASKPSPTQQRVAIDHNVSVARVNEVLDGKHDHLLKRALPSKR